MAGYPVVCLSGPRAASGCRAAAGPGCEVAQVTALESLRAVAVPEQGSLVRVRDRYWVVESVRQSSRPVDPMSSNGWTRHHLVGLVPIDDKGSPRR